MHKEFGFNNFELSDLAWKANLYHSFSCCRACRKNFELSDQPRSLLVNNEYVLWAIFNSRIINEQIAVD